MPFHIIGEYAKKHVGADAVGPAVMDWAKLDINGLEAAEGALGIGELLVRLDGGSGIERRGREASAQHIDAVEGLTRKIS